MHRKLYRSSTNKVIAGVCGGIGEYFDIDPVIVRIVLVLLVLAPGHGWGLLAYIVAWIIMPKRDPQLEPVEPQQEQEQEATPSSWHRYLPGLILIGIGMILLVHENWYWFRWELFWPSVIIAAGLILIFKRPSVRKSEEQDPMTEVNRQQPKPENGGSLS